MRTIYAEYNINHDSIDVYTSAGYMLRIDCWKAEKNLIIPGLSEPPVRTLRATCPENESHIFR